MTKIKCPICGTEVEAYHELSQSEPYTHTNPYDGIHIYGAYSAPKETICYENNFLHFAFYDSEGNLTDHRLVKLNVENPTTRTPSEEFWEGYNERDLQDFDEQDDDYSLSDYNEEDELPF